MKIHNVCPICETPLEELSGKFDSIGKLLGSVITCLGCGRSLEWFVSLISLSDDTFERMTPEQQDAMRKQEDSVSEFLQSRVQDRREPTVDSEESP